MGELNYSDLRFNCKLNGRIKPTPQSLEKILMQQRLVDSFESGILIDDYNIYVSDFDFCETDDAIKSLIKRFDKKEIPGDIVAVNNFLNPYKPKIIRLLQGSAKELESDIIYLKDKIKEIMETAETKTNKLFEKEFSKLERLASKKGLSLKMINPTTFNYSPILPIETTEEGDAFKECIADFQNEFVNKFIKTDVIKKLGGLEVNEFINLNIEQQVKKEIRKICKTYTAGEDIKEFFNSFENFLFQTDSEESIRDKLTALGVNILVDNSKRKRAPIIFEDLPSFSNLIGKIQESLNPAEDKNNSYFMKLDAGSLIKANGGYLVTDIESLLTDPEGKLTYTALKNALLNKKVKIKKPVSLLGESVDADEIDIDVKVILLGSGEIYEMLCENDAVFKDLFRLHADMRRSVKNDAPNQKKYAAYLKQFSKENKLSPVTKSGCEALIEQASRLTERKNKLSVEIGELTDLILEADLTAKKQKSKIIDRTLIEKTIASKNHRNGLVFEEQNDLMKNYYLLDVSSKKIGQINGLTVSETTDVSYGAPARITASVGTGKDGIIYADVEAELAQEILKKSTHIINSYLTEKYCKNFPLQFSARVTFEQSYCQMEGDSASSTTIYALLSALSQIPIKQSLAVTGSVDTFGNVQAIGGVNAKIEGFYDICKLLQGLTGEQGVIIPQHNAADLMLRPDVVKSVKEGNFHVYSVKTIDEGLEILTGRPAEQIHELAKTEMLRLALAYQNFGKIEKDKYNA